MTADQTVELVDYGLITNDERACSGVKLSNFATGLKAVLTKYPGVSWIGQEDVYEQNVVTMKVLSRFAGVSILTIQEMTGIGATYGEDALTKALSAPRKPKPERGIYTPAPLTVTKLCGIKGYLHREEKKEAVIRWVNMYFGKRFVFEDNDLCDSIAVGCATIFKVNGWTF